MSQVPVNIAEGSYASTSLPIDVVARASPDIFTTIATAAISSTTRPVTFAVTSGAAPFPQSGSFPIRIDSEELLVTSGAGTSSWTASTINGTAAATHALGANVSLLVGVQRVEPVYATKQISFKGRAASFLIPGAAGTAGQKLASLFNASGSAVLVDLDTVLVDLNSTAARTVQVPVVRVYKVTAAPTGGTAMTKVAEDSTLTTNSSVALLQGASADNTASAITSTLTVGVNVLTQVGAAQLYTVVGFAPFDPFRFFPGGDEYVTLNAGEGVVVMLDYTASAANPSTDRWTVDFHWYEYTNAA